MMTQFYLCCIIATNDVGSFLFTFNLNIKTLIKFGTYLHIVVHIFSPKLMNDLRSWHLAVVNFLIVK
jgi:hypothetical protein